MYAPGYGFQVPNVPPTFNNAAPPPNQNPHMQQGSVPTQPGQHMMYNPNQFAGMPGGQPGFVGGPNPAMMSGAAPGPAGMMQNAGMPHMAANGQSELSPSLPPLVFLCAQSIQQSLVYVLRPLTLPEAACASPWRLRRSAVVVAA